MYPERHAYILDSETHLTRARSTEYQYQKQTNAAQHAALAKKRQAGVWVARKGQSSALAGSPVGCTAGDGRVMCIF